METPMVRRAAIGTFLFSCLVMLFAVYVGIVYHGDLDAGAEWIAALDFYQWVLIFSITFGVALLFLLFLLIWGVPSTRAAGAVVSVECKNCATTFDVADSGDRPLYYACPACGAEDVLPETPGELAELTVEEVEAPAPRGAEEDSLMVRCSNCAEVFGLPYSDRRPVYGDCPKCGKRGVLPATPLEGGLPVIDLEGIGPSFADKLALVGISNSEQLRAADLDAVSAITEIPTANLEAWKAMADLVRVQGIGPQFAEALARAGVRSVKELAAKKPKDLAKQVRTYLEDIGSTVMGTGVNEARARAWVKEAKKLGSS